MSSLFIYASFLMCGRLDLPGKIGLGLFGGPGVSKQLRLNQHLVRGLQLVAQLLATLRLQCTKRESSSLHCLGFAFGRPFRHLLRDELRQGDNLAFHARGFKGLHVHIAAAHSDYRPGVTA
jgi:hypothetical protein